MSVVRLLNPQPDSTLLHLSRPAEAIRIARVGEHEIEVVSAQIEHERDLRAIGTDILHQRPIWPPARRVHALTRPRVESAVAPHDVGVV